jgi:hypothetical protein
MAKRLLDDPTRREQFLTLISLGVNLKAAGRSLGMNEETVYRMIKNDEAFRQVLRLRNGCNKLRPTTMFQHLLRWLSTFIKCPVTARIPVG